MIKYKNQFLTAAIAAALSFSMSAHADAESGQLLSNLTVNSDGSVTFLVQSPSTNLLSNCLGVITIPSSSTNKPSWLSQLLTAKANQMTINFRYSSCNLISLTMQ